MPQGLEDICASLCSSLTPQERTDCFSRKTAEAAKIAVPGCAKARGIKKPEESAPAVRFPLRERLQKTKAAMVSQENH